MMLLESQIALLEALKASLFCITPSYPFEVDWDEVIKEANAQTVTGLISSVIPVRDEMNEQCKAAYIRFMYEQDRLLSLFYEANIPYVIIKGAAAAVYYSKPYLRSMGDIDILVSRGCFVKSVELLESNGYICVDGKDEEGNIPDDVRELTYFKNGIEVDLHHHFSSFGYNMDDILERAIDRRVCRTLNGHSFYMLPFCENGLVLLGHINQHLQNNLLGLRQIIDWEMYLSSVDDRAAWENQFTPVAEQIGLLKLASYVTKMCIDHLGLQGSFEMCNGINDDYSDELLEIILTDGNFGRRMNPAQQREEKVARGALYDIRRYGFFSYFQGVGLRTWSLCKKYPILKPVAFIYGIGRLSIRFVKALFSNKCLLKEMNEAQKRYGLYQRIGVRQGVK